MLAGWLVISSVIKTVAAADVSIWPINNFNKVRTTKKKLKFLPLRKTLYIGFPGMYF